jgi:methylated-DNA-[protein]-cysteine S-methyltransferase
MSRAERAWSEAMGAQSLSSREQYCLFDTGLGACGVAWSEHGVTRLQLPEANRSATERRLCARPGAGSTRAQALPGRIGALVAQLQRYFAGERVDFSGAVVDLSAVNDFHRRIYELTRAIGWGRTASYGDLARQAGAPGAARAVGQAMGHNPVPIIIPCHRVLAAGRKIGGFSAHGGAVTKERLLAMEGVYPGDGTPMLPGLLSARVVGRHP